MFSRTGKAAEEKGGGQRMVIAIDKDKSSQHALKWAVDNKITGSSSCILVHVETKFRNIPEDQNDGQQEAYQFFLPFRGFCSRRGVKATEVLLHDLDVSSAIINYLTDNNVTSVVVGASARNSFLKSLSFSLTMPLSLSLQKSFSVNIDNSFNFASRKFTQTDVASNVLKKAPRTCAVFVVSKGKLITSRSASRSEASQAPLPTGIGTASSKQMLLSHLPYDSELDGESDRSSVRSGGSIRTPQHHRPRSSMSQYSSSTCSSWSGLSQSDFGSDTYSCSDSVASSDTSYSILERSFYGSPFTSISSIPASEMDDAPYGPPSMNYMDDQSSQSRTLEMEMRRLRLQLQKLNSTLGTDTIPPRESPLDLQEQRAADSRMVEEAKEVAEATKTLFEMEEAKSESEIQATGMAERIEGMQSQKRILMELQAKLEERQNMSEDNRQKENMVSYRRYSIKDIEDATDGFSDALKVGEGGYGPVYKACLDYTAVAIKILKSDVTSGLKQFHQEIEVLSCMRHPNMVTLLGACPEYGCLVYEYMENGTLEDRLFCKDNTPPLSWRMRFIISAEIATGLLFLHQAKPEPLVHRDLKPANILLDRHFVSKISDVGLARLVPQAMADNFSQYHMTAAAGTFCYIDPEYQQTGLLGVKSDLYSFGVVLLQIITAMPPIGLSHTVGKAIKHNRFTEILDPKVQDWPLEETLALAKLALQCCELRKRDRPDLALHLLPLLNKLKNLASDSP